MAKRWAGVCVALLVPALAAHAAPDAPPSVPAPIGWREPAPLARLFLQLPFEAPEVVPAGRLEASLDVVYSNSVLVGYHGALALDVHVETAQPTVSLRYGVAPRVEVVLAVPFVADEGGFLDRPIEEVERWFDALNQNRVGRPRDQAWFVLDGSAGRVDVRGTGGGLGDVWAGAKVMLAERSGGSGGSLALRAAVKLPTGRLPYGSEELDVGGGLLAAWTWRALALRLALDLAVPTASLRSGLVATRPYGAAMGGVTWRINGRVALHAEGSGHTSPLTGGIHAMDRATAYALLGVSVELTRGLTLRAGVVENIFSPFRGADIAFPFTLVARF